MTSEPLVTVQFTTDVTNAIYLTVVHELLTRLDSEKWENLSGHAIATYSELMSSLELAGVALVSEAEYAYDDELLGILRKHARMEVVDAAT